MATNIKTVMTYPLDGSTTDFNIPFEYLARKFVRVTLIGVDRKELILNQDYRFATKTTISTTRALGPADGYNLIEIRRYTSATERLVDFTDGSILRAYDLNISQVQTLHVAEEARDLTADTIGVNNDGDLDARGRRIVNVADAKDPGDAINLGQVQKWNDSALNSANRARAEADRATVRASEAATSAGNSASSANLSRDWAIKESPVEGTFKSSRSYALDSMAYRDASKSSADASAASAGAAKTSEINAKNSEIATKASETNAKTSETNAKASEVRAIEEANKLENMNDLAGAIKEVLRPEGDTSGKVVWKYDIDSKVLRAYNGMSIGWDWDGTTSSPFMNFYRGKDAPQGTLSVDAGELRLSNIGRLRVQAQLNVAGAYTQEAGGVWINSGDWIYMSNRVPSGGNGHRTQGIFLKNGMGNNGQRSEYFLEDNGQRMAQQLVVTNGTNQAWYTFEEHGLVMNKNMRISWGGRTASYQENGDITGQGVIWSGGSLSAHCNRFLTNIWIGAGRQRHVGQQTWEGWIDNGCVMRGIKQIRAGGDCFIEELFFNEIWKGTDVGAWII